MFGCARMADGEIGSCALPNAAAASHVAAAARIAARGALDRGRWAFGVGPWTLGMALVLPIRLGLPALAGFTHPLRDGGAHAVADAYPRRLGLERFRDAGDAVSGPAPFAAPDRLQRVH